MFLFLLPLLFDFACMNNQYADESAMCSVIQMQESRIAQMSSENLELLGKIAQLEKFALETLEKPAVTPTPLPAPH